MKPILLVADASPEIGWGHAMRTLAVAQALEDRDVSMAWLTTTPQAIRKLGPPCPVGRLGAMKKARAMFVDITDESALWMAPLLLDDLDCPWVYTTDRPAPDEENGIIIAPHFGSEAWDFGAGLVCAGPRWMPLRRAFATRKRHAYGPKAPVLAYRPPENWTLSLSVEDPKPHILQPGDSEQWWNSEWSLAVVPPSTLAYECMALGIPVMLLRGISADCDRVGINMAKAGVANWWHNGIKELPPDRESMRDRAKRLVDGGGAARVARLLIQGEG